MQHPLVVLQGGPTAHGFKWDAPPQGMEHMPAEVQRHRYVVQVNAVGDAAEVGGHPVLQQPVDGAEAYLLVVNFGQPKAHHRWGYYKHDGLVLVQYAGPQQQAAQFYPHRAEPAPRLRVAQAQQGYPATQRQRIRTGEQAHGGKARPHGNDLEQHLCPARQHDEREGSHQPVPAAAQAQHQQGPQQVKLFLYTQRPCMDEGDAR